MRGPNNTGDLVQPRQLRRDNVNRGDEYELQQLVEDQP